MDIYRTSDRGIAAYALLLGHDCIGCIPATRSDSRRMDFVFIDIPDPRSLERGWYSGHKLKMAPIEYFRHYITITHLVKNPLTQEQVEALRG